MSEDEEFEFRARAEEEERQRAAASNLTTPPASAAENVMGQAAIAATPTATELGVGAVRGALNAPVTALTAPITSPISTVRNVAQAIENVVPQVPTQKPMPAGSPVLSVPATRPMNVGELLKAGARGVGSAMMAPENMFTAPYNLAAYEQAKIRANPTAPEYADNPYAMTVRGQAPTQAAAGAMNQQRALIGQQYGGLNPREQAIMAQERQRQLNIQKNRAIINQPPTANNFIERMKAMSELYGGIGQ